MDFTSIITNFEKQFQIYALIEVGFSEVYFFNIKNIIKMKNVAKLTLF